MLFSYKEEVVIDVSFALIYIMSDINSISEIVLKKQICYRNIVNVLEKSTLIMSNIIVFA